MHPVLTNFTWDASWMLSRVIVYHTFTRYITLEGDEIERSFNRCRSRNHSSRR